jgi:transcriptional regulator with XRE-family HTH domain
MEKTTLGQALIERRTSLEIDKARAARMIGIARSTYTAYELDLRRIAPESLPALGKFLDASLDDLVHLYGATCMAQARETLLHHMFHSDPPVVEVVATPPAITSLGARAKLEKEEDPDRDLSVLKRVFFDVVTTSGHEIAPAFATAPQGFGATSAPPTASVFEHHDAVTLVEAVAPTKLKSKKDKDKSKKDKKSKGKKKSPKDKKKDKKKSKK